jgi:spore cortex formation protein SpoVR/YcgB (stage V sporulation)
MVEFLHSHTNVVMQPDFDDPRFSGINPYALGFAMMQDIARIAEAPTEEDRAWFPELAGSGDAMAALREVWANYRDDSFILQFLSPRLIRKFRLFHVMDDTDEPILRVDAIHDEPGYRRIRQRLSRQYDVAWLDPDIQVVDVDLAGDRKLIVHHRALNRVLLDEEDARHVLQHMADLWGYDVVLKEIDPASDAVLREHSARARDRLR